MPVPPDDKLIAAARRAYLRGEDVLAIQVTRRILQAGPDPEALFIMGGALQRLGQAAPAARALLRLVRLFPDAVDPVVRAGKLLLQLGHTEPVLAALERLLADHPDHDELWALWTRAERRASRLGVLERALVWRAERLPSAPTLQLAAGEVLLGLGLATRAAPFLQRSGPVRPEVWETLARGLATADPAACIRLVEDRLSDRPHEASALLLQAGDVPGALRHALRLPPGDGWRARLRLWSGQPAEAAQAEDATVRAAHALVMGDMAQVVALLPSPTTPETIVLRAEALRHLGRPAEAWAVISDISPSSGEHLAAHLNRILLLHQISPERLEASRVSEVLDMLAPMGLQGDPLAVMEAALQGMAGNRTATSTWRVGGTLQRLHHATSARDIAARWRGLLRFLTFEEVIAHASAAVERAEHPLLYTHRAELYLWWGRYDEALRDCAAALQISERTRWAWFGRASALLCLGQPDAALAALDASERLLEPLPNTLGLRGEALLRLGRPDEACVLFARSCALQPGRLSAWIGLALAQIATGTSAHATLQGLQQRAPGWWQHATADRVAAHPGEAPEPQAVLEQLLRMARGSRASGLCTYFREDGIAHFVP